MVLSEDAVWNIIHGVLTPGMDATGIGTACDALWMAANPLKILPEVWDYDFCTCTSTRPLWAFGLKAHCLGKIAYLPLSVLPCIVAGMLPFPNLSWLGILGGSCQNWLGQWLHCQTPLSKKWVWSLAISWSIRPPIPYRSHCSSRSSYHHFWSDTLHVWAGISAR